MHLSGTRDCVRASVWNDGPRWSMVRQKFSDGLMRGMVR
jgi:hypothetical protein